MSFKWIETERDGKTARLWLNRTDKRNALSIELRNEIDECLGNWESDDSISTVIFLSRGKVFCAGFDKSEFFKTEPDHIRAMKDSSNRYHRRLAEFPKPVIAAIQGPALGGGFDLAALCDIRIGTPESVFSHPEIKFGAPVLFRPLREIIGGGLARELSLTGRVLPSDQALACGFLSRIVKGEMLEETCQKIADQINEAPLSALKATKGQIIAAYGGWAGILSGSEDSSGFFDFS